MKRSSILLIATAFVSAVLCFSGCSKKATGPSSFSLPTDGTTLVFTAGQSQSVSYSGENIEACTAKPPMGWYASVQGNMITIVAPDLSTTFEGSGQVSVYARGTDKVEFVYYIPVTTEALLDKTEWNIVYASSEEPMSYANQKFVREDDPSSTMTGYAKDIIDGSYSSIWAYNYGRGDKAPFYFVIDLGKEMTITSFDLWAQRGNKNLSDPTNTSFTRHCGEAVFEFATTVTGNGMADLGGTGSGNWSHKHSFYTDHLRNQRHNIVHLDEAVTARYIRFRYVKGYYAETDEAPAYTGGALAELDVFGY